MEQRTLETLEEATQGVLEDVVSLDISTKEGREALTKATHLVELLVTSDKDAWDYDDKAERRKIEQEKNKTMADIERKKQKLSIGRISLEMAKVVVPVVISLIGYGIYQKRLLIFEKTGRVSSMAGRELHLPKFLK